MLDISHCQVGCDKFPEENVWARSSTDLSARVWPGSFWNRCPTEEEEEEDVWEPCPEKQAGSICYLSHRLRCQLGSTLSTSVRAVQAFEE